ncbi:MAG TPA: sigma factor, partial [Verrucomicrobiae bacterium]|nr:sigma factor [Verrucomicrobiae bacterium]
MHSRTDSELMIDYAERRSEAAFSELVRRYVDLVYSAALRMTRDPHLAQDVTQGAFAALAKNASQLAGRPVLSSWLHRVAQNIAAQSIRTEIRRRAREKEAHDMNISAEPDASWDEIAPHLDQAVG